MNNGISEEFSENAGYNFKGMFERMSAEVLEGITADARVNPEIKKIAVSVLREKAGKPKRGRPQIVDKILKSQYVGLGLEVKTARSLQNFHYQVLAIKYIHDDPRFTWLFDLKANTQKKSILTELGRCQDKETIIAFALRICELKPKTRDAIAMLRRARTGMAPKPDIIDLVAHLAGALDRYTADHPDITREQMLLAIDNFRSIVEDEDE
jgi:hypothetical protein